MMTEEAFQFLAMTNFRDKVALSTKFYQVFHRQHAFEEALNDGIQDIKRNILTLKLGCRNGAFLSEIETFERELGFLSKAIRRLLWSEQQIGHTKREQKVSEIFDFMIREAEKVKHNIEKKQSERRELENIIREYNISPTQKSEEENTKKKSSRSLSLSHALTQKVIYLHMYGFSSEIHILYLLSSHI